eukprot:scaffold6674_cov74-Attheya_sp.AAC.1
MPEQITAILDNMAHHVNSSIQQEAETMAFHHKNNAGTALLATWQIVSRLVTVCHSSAKRLRLFEFECVSGPVA